VQWVLVLVLMQGPGRALARERERVLGRARQPGLVPVALGVVVVGRGRCGLRWCLSWMG